jgi:hypothetical protein
MAWGYYADLKGIDWVVRDPDGTVTATADSEEEAELKAAELNSDEPTESMFYGE